MTTTNKLAYLQEKLSDKTISLGCVFIAKNKLNKSYNCIMIDNDRFVNEDSDIVEELYYEQHICDCGFKIKKILGHPVTADHILLWAKKHNLDIEIDSTQMIHIYMGADFYIPWQLGKDLTKQQEETINELYLFVKQVEDGR